MERCITVNGKEKNLIGQYNIEGISYYVSSEKKVYVKSEDGTYVEFNYSNKDSNIKAAAFFREILKPTRSLDVIEDYTR